MEETETKGNYVARTFRLERELADALKLEATLREINGATPSSQQEIVAAALRSWFEREALSRPRREEAA